MSNSRPNKYQNKMTKKKWRQIEDILTQMWQKKVLEWNP